MAIKRLVLEILEKNRSESVSGEYIANMLNISRNMIWRAVKELRNDGYQIEAATNKGYRLTDENDIISAEGIKPFLTSPELSEIIYVYSEIDSTNREAKARAINKAAHGTVIIADKQTAGRGRYGKDFFSPMGSGIYMSFMLHANIMKFTTPTAITAYAAVCVCEAIKNVCNIDTSIKWVNDIFLNGKKICGILTEGITEFENQRISEIILGIGINVSTKRQDLPEYIKDIASSLYPDRPPAVTRNQLTAEIINRILSSEVPDEVELFEKYKKRLFMLGKNITIVQGSNMYTAKAIDIDSHGQLIIQEADGRIQTLSSGEITTF